LINFLSHNEIKVGNFRYDMVNNFLNKVISSIDNDIVKFKNSDDTGEDDTERQQDQDVVQMAKNALK